MAHCTDCQSRVMINGWLSYYFPVSRSVRQGSPLSPSIFALCIEPLAALIRCKVSGIRTPGLTPFQNDIPPFQGQFFADDGACGLQDQRDILKLQSCVKLFELASGSKLSHSKTFLYPLNAGAETSCLQMDGWRIERNPFRYLGIQVGRNINVRLLWTDIASRICRRMASIPMYDLPIRARCQIINTYCYTKILFTDQFCPSPADIIDRIEHAAVDAIWKNRRHQITLAGLQTPCQHGGFGLLPLRMLLEHRRARWIVALLNDDWRTNRYVGNMRLRLTQEITRAAQNVVNFLDSPWEAVTLAPRTLEPTGRTWNWRSLFGVVSNQAERIGRWQHAYALSKAFLPARWQTFFSAFQSLVDITAASKARWQTTFLTNLDGDWKAINCLTPFVLRYNGSHDLSNIRTGMAANRRVTFPHPISCMGAIAGCTF